MEVFTVDRSLHFRLCISMNERVHVMGAPLDSVYDMLCIIIIHGNKLVLFLGSILGEGEMDHIADVASVVSTMW